MKFTKKIIILSIVLIVFLGCRGNNKFTVKGIYIVNEGINIRRVGLVVSLHEGNMRGPIREYPVKLNRNGTFKVSFEKKHEEYFTIRHYTWSGQLPSPVISPEMLYYRIPDDKPVMELEIPYYISHKIIIQSENNRSVFFTPSELNFRWNKIENADSYSVYIHRLNNDDKYDLELVMDLHNLKSNKFNYNEAVSSDLVEGILSVEDLYSMPTFGRVRKPLDSGNYRIRIEASKDMIDNDELPFFTLSKEAVPFYFSLE